MGVKVYDHSVIIFAQGAQKVKWTKAHFWGMIKKGAVMIYLIPVGGMDEEPLRWLMAPLEERFGYPCAIGEGVAMPPEAYNPRRGQYLSSAILRTLEERLPPDALRALGVADVDLYVPQLNFVFGEAQLGGRVAVISVARLQLEFYGLEPNPMLARERMLKEAVHELGHTFGLRHCRNERCVMHFSNSLLDTDRKGDDFCPRCRRMLRL